MKIQLLLTCFGEHMQLSLAIRVCTDGFKLKDFSISHKVDVANTTLSRRILDLYVHSDQRSAAFTILDLDPTSSQHLMRLASSQKHHQPAKPTGQATLPSSPTMRFSDLFQYHRYANYGPARPRVPPPVHAPRAPVPLISGPLEPIAPPPQCAFARLATTSSPPGYNATAAVPRADTT